MKDFPTDDRRTPTAAAAIPAPGIGNRCGQCGAAMEPGDIFCGECGFISRSFIKPTPSALQQNQAETAEVTRLETRPPLTPASGIGPLPEVPAPGAEPTRTEFLLQFSTGETVLVSGTGLVGRNPQPEPAEFFDHRVVVSDPARTVSKTHLEFGQERGGLWIRDRFSGNGTAVFSDDGAQHRLDPGKRYLVARGSKVYLGEQYFMVR